MATYTSKVKASKYDKPYDKGDVHLHYYIVELENGTTAALGVKQKDDERTIVGAEITYDLINGQIKNSSIVSKANGQKPQEQKSDKSYNKFATKNYSKGKSPEEYLSYICGYAEHMVVAGKTKNTDIAAWKVLVRSMYAEIKDILNEENQSK